MICDQFRIQSTQLLNHLNNVWLFPMKKNGFTLIELVVVIVILGILAVVAAPKFMNLQNDARDASLKGLKGAIESTLDVTYAKLSVLGLENASYVVNHEDMLSPDQKGSAVVADLSSLGCTKESRTCVFEYGYPSNYGPTLATLINGISNNEISPNDDFVAVWLPGDKEQSLAITFKNNVEKYDKDGQTFAKLKSNKCYIRYPRPLRDNHKPKVTIIPCE